MTKEKRVYVRLVPGRVDVLEVVVLEDGRKLRRETVKADVARLGHHPKRRLHDRKLLTCCQSFIITIL